MSDMFWITADKKFKTIQEYDWSENEEQILLFVAKQWSSTTIISKTGLPNFLAPEGQMPNGLQTVHTEPGAPCSVHPMLYWALMQAPPSSPCCVHVQFPLDTKPVTPPPQTLWHMGTVPLCDLESPTPPSPN